MSQSPLASNHITVTNNNHNDNNNTPKKEATENNHAAKISSIQHTNIQAQGSKVQGLFKLVTNINKNQKQQENKY